MTFIMFATVVLVVMVHSMQNSAQLTVTVLGIGAALFGYALVQYIASRRPEYVINVKGIRGDALGREIPWSAIRRVRGGSRSVIFQINEGGYLWHLPIDLGMYEISREEQACLDRIWATYALESSAVDELPADTLEADEYKLPLSRVTRLLVVAMLLVPMVGFFMLQYTSPSTGIILVPIEIILGCVAGFQSPDYVMVVRADRHALWVNPKQAVSWTAIEAIHFSDDGKTVIECLMRTGCLPGETEASYLDIGKTDALGDEVLARLADYHRRVTGNSLSAQSVYVPNTLTASQRWMIGFIALALLLVGGYGVWIDELWIPEGESLHGLPARTMYLAWVLAAVSLSSRLVDHYDRRNNEKHYKHLQTATALIAMLLFAVALLLHMYVDGIGGEKQRCIPQTIHTSPAPDGRRVAIAYQLACPGNAPSQVEISVLDIGVPLADEYGNTARIANPEKLHGLRWRGETLQVIHQEPRLLRPETSPEVAVFAVLN